MEKLEKRMYFFVPYQLTGIQHGIQCGHASLEFAGKYWDNEIFTDFRKNWKTWVILNGGTTNTNPDRLGSLNIIHNQLLENGINCEVFYEPDLQDAMTAVCFVCDERVFDKEKYPDPIEPDDDEDDDFEYYADYKKDFIEMIGGEQNFFLRELIRGKKLA